VEALRDTHHPEEVPLYSITLAAGSQARFDTLGAGFRKQLIKVHGESLLARQYRQVGPELALVTRDSLLLDASQSIGFERVIIPAVWRWTCETLFASLAQCEPGRRLVVLLGDVYYSDALMAQLEICNRSMAFFGNAAETWAIVSGDMPRLASACAKTIEAVKRGDAVGSLRNVYHSMANLPYAGDAYEPEFDFPAMTKGSTSWRQSEHTLWRYWSDETCDFDEPRHLKRVQTLEYGA
jgi:hypothetical protein